MPVRRVQTIVWIVAALLAFTATFLRAGILGLPVGSALTFGVLLRALTALMIGRLTNLTAITTSAVALGVLELGIGWNASSPLLIDPILAVVVVRRPGAAAAQHDARRDERRLQLAGSRRGATCSRLARSPPEVRLVRWALGVVLAAFAVGLPHFLSVDTVADRRRPCSSTASSPSRSSC